MTKRRKVIVHIGTSADGYIARPDGDLEWLTSRPAPAGFYGMNAFTSSIDTKLLGRKTYEVKSTYILQPGPAALTEGVRQLHAIIAHAVGMNLERELMPKEAVDPDLHAASARTRGVLIRPSKGRLLK